MGRSLHSSTDPSPNRLSWRACVITLEYPAKRSADRFYPVSSTTLGNLTALQVELIQRTDSRPLSTSKREQSLCAVYAMLGRQRSWKRRSTVQLIFMTLRQTPSGNANRRRISQAKKVINAPFTAQVAVPTGRQPRFTCSAAMISSWFVPGVVERMTSHKRSPV